MLIIYMVPFWHLIHYLLRNGIKKGAEILPPLFSDLYCVFNKKGILLHCKDLHKTTMREFIEK